MWGGGVKKSILVNKKAIFKIDYYFFMTHSVEKRTKISIYHLKYFSWNLIFIIIYLGNMLLSHFFSWNWLKWFPHCVKHVVVGFGKSIQLLYNVQKVLFVWIIHFPKKKKKWCFSRNILDLFLFYKKTSSKLWGHK